MTCVTEGGNPLPTLLWLRNGLPLNERSMLDQIAEASEAAEAASGANAAGAAIGGSKCNDEESKCTFGLSSLGIQIRNMKIDFNTGGTWRRVMQ